MTTLTRAEIGALGEQLAVDHLESLGLRVLIRNWRCRYGELDVIAAGEIVPEYAGARTQLSKANGALQFVETNAAMLRRGFTEGRAPSALADPFGDRLGNRGKHDPDA